jgi:hypothetical protein
LVIKLLLWAGGEEGEGWGFGRGGIFGWERRGRCVLSWAISFRKALLLSSNILALYI